MLEQKVKLFYCHLSLKPGKIFFQIFRPLQLSNNQAFILSLKVKD